MKSQRRKQTQHSVREAVHPTSDLPEPDREWNLLRDALLPGALAGTLAALTTTVLLVAYSAIFAGDLWLPFRLAAGLFFRERGGHGLLGVLVGLLVHFTVAGGLATGFALLLPRGGTAVGALGWAALYVLALWPVMTLLVLPFGSPPLSSARHNATILLVHLVLGGWLATVPALRRTLVRLDTARHRVQALRASVA
jgi:hypothetical protein